MERIKTGIDGLDGIIEGGIPKGNFVVVTGGPGTGKTILASQFLANGATKYNEKGLFISVEQSKEEIISQAKQFGWDFTDLEKKGKLKIITLNAEKLFEMKTTDEIKELVKKDHYNRIVVDSITSFIYSTISPSSIAIAADKGVQPKTLSEMSRANAALLIELVKQTGITALGLAQKVEGMPGDTIDTVSEFKGDGLIVLDLSAVGEEESRTLQVKKMRETKIKAVPYSMEFTKTGIKISVK